VDGQTRMGETFLVAFVPRWQSLWDLVVFVSHFPPSRGQSRQENSLVEDAGRLGREYESSGDRSTFVGFE
jgi:hypothetical protein